MRHRSKKHPRGIQRVGTFRRRKSGKKTPPTRQSVQTTDPLNRIFNV